MAKKRKGENVSFYLEETLNQFLSEKADELQVSKSEIINNLIKHFKSLNNCEIKIETMHLVDQSLEK